MVITVAEWLRRADENIVLMRCEGIACQDCPFGKVSGNNECHKTRSSTWSLSAYKVAAILYEKYKISEKLKWL